MGVVLCNANNSNYNPENLLNKNEIEQHEIEIEFIVESPLQIQSSFQNDNENLQNDKYKRFADNKINKSNDNLGKLSSKFKEKQNLKQKTFSSQKKNKLEEKFCELIFYKKNNSEEILLDGEQIVTHILKGIQKVLEEQKGKELPSICISCVPHTAICFDRRTGQVQGNTIIRSDNFLQKYYQLFLSGQERSIFRTMRKQTGMKLYHHHTAVKIMYLLNCDDEVISQVRAGTDLLFGTIDSFVIFRLTGNLFTSLSMASTTQLVDLENNPYSWDQKLLRFFGIDQKQLPQIRPTVFQYGKIDLNIKSKGFWRKKYHEEQLTNARKTGLNNQFLTEVEIEDKVQMKLESQREQIIPTAPDSDDAESEDSDSESDGQGDDYSSLLSRRTKESESQKYKDNKNMEKVDAIKNFTEDVPNVFISDYKCTQQFNASRKIRSDVTKGNLKVNNMAKMNLHIDCVSIDSCFSMLGSNAISQLYDTLIIQGETIQIQVQMDEMLNEQNIHQFRVAENLRIDTCVCFDYIEHMDVFDSTIDMKDRDSQSVKLQTQLNHFHQKDSHIYPLFDQYNKPYAHRKQWKVKQMQIVSIECKNVVDKISKGLSIGSNLKEITDRLSVVMSDSASNKPVQVNRFDRDFFYNIGIENNLYHMSKAMLESLTNEVYIFIDSIMHQVKFQSNTECSITQRNQCLTHEINHQKGINLFQEIHSFNKESIEEDQMIPKQSRPNLRIVVDGKQSKLQCLMELQADILNRKLYYTSAYNFDNNGHIIGMFLSITMALTRNSPQKVIRNNKNVLGKNSQVPNEQRITQDEISKLETTQDIITQKINKKLQQNKKKIEDYRKIVNFQQFKVFKYVQSFLKKFIEEKQRKKVDEVLDDFKSVDFTDDARMKLVNYKVAQDLNVRMSAKNFTNLGIASALLK